MVPRVRSTGNLSSTSNIFTVIETMSAAYLVTMWYIWASLYPGNAVSASSSAG